jgi:hypothetical protein
LRHTKRFMSKPSLIAVLVASAWIAGCSSGDEDVLSELSIAGIVADGQSVIAGAQVTAACAVGTGSTTTDGNGRYVLSIDGGKGPCVIKAEINPVYYSIGEGTVNVTPLTTLLVSYLAGATGLSLDELFSSTTDLTKISESQIEAAQQAVVEFLFETYGITLTEANFLTELSASDLDALGPLLTEDGSVKSDVLEAFAQEGEQSTEPEPPPPPPPPPPDGGGGTGGTGGIGGSD